MVRNCSMINREAREVVGEEKHTWIIHRTADSLQIPPIPTILFFRQSVQGKNQDVYSTLRGLRTNGCLQSCYMFAERVVFLGQKNMNLSIYLCVYMYFVNTYLFACTCIYICVFALEYTYIYGSDGENENPEKC